jgi:vitamin B12 transporter
MKYLFLLGCSVMIAAPAWAQDSFDAADPVARPRVPTPLIVETTIPVAALTAEKLAAEFDTTITVVATGRNESIDRTGQSIAIVAADELASVQGPDLTRVLTRLPGVSFSRNGGLGGQTGLNVRGANADQLLVLIDGVRIADYASPGGGYDLGNLLGGNLSKLELLRGSNSVVWGSQAIGGVLAVTTEDLDGVRGTAEFGAYDTLLLSGGAGFAGEHHALSLSSGYARSDGFSAQSGGTEADGYRQWNVSGKAHVDLAPSLTLRATGRYADSRLAIDLFGPNDLDFQDTREASARAGLDYSDDTLNLSAGLAWADVRRDYETGFGPSSFTGRSRRAELNGRLRLPSELALDFGADTDWTRSTSSFDPDASARQSSGHALLGYYGDGLTLAAGVRLDDHDRFGSHWTFGANGAVPLGADWRIRASFGEGFKAPTLYQLFGSFVGNTALEPETSRSFEAGIEKGDRNGVLHLAATAFRRDSRNLIDLDSSFVYQNVARARAEGFELELGARVTDNFHAQAAYTWLKARDLSANRDLARRPRHALSLSTDWTTPLAGLALGADLRLQGDSVEYDFFGTPIPLDGFVVATLRASVPLGEHFELHGRVENLGNVDYQTAAGFNSPGRSAYAGVRLRW